MKKDPFLLFATVQGIANNCINANKAVHSFQMFSSAICKILVQKNLQDDILHYARI